MFLIFYKIIQFYSQGCALIEYRLATLPAVMLTTYLDTMPIQVEY